VYGGLCEKVGGGGEGTNRCRRESTPDNENTVTVLAHLGE